MWRVSQQSLHIRSLASSMRPLIARANAPRTLPDVNIDTGECTDGVAVGNGRGIVTHSFCRVLGVTVSRGEERTEDTPVVIAESANFSANGILLRGRGQESEESQTA